jgi:hypothetical protein
VVDDVGLCRSGKTENSRRQAAGDDGRKSELLHFDAFFCVSVSAWFITSLTDLTG